MNSRFGSRLLRYCAAVSWLAGIASVAGLPATAFAQEKFPARPVRVIVPFPAGGINDMVARPVLQKMSESLGASFVVENRPGASGMIGTAAVARSDADGYTLLLGAASTMAVVPHMYRTAGYSPIDDFAPVGGLASVASVLITTNLEALPDFAALVAAAKRKPAGLTYGSAGPGTSHHMQTSLLELTLGIRLMHVPFKGGAPAIASLLGRQIDLLMEPVPTAMPHIKSGKAIGLGVTTTKRSPLLPDVPTFVELGVKDFVVSTWFGLFAPARTPAATIEVLNRALTAALNDPGISGSMRGLGLDPMPMSSADLAKYVAEENERWQSVITRAKIGVE